MSFPAFGARLGAFWAPGARSLPGPPGISLLLLNFYIVGFRGGLKQLAKELVNQSGML